MQSTPVITLTTDFGHKGPFVGVMKGVILGRLPTARIVDLTHEIHVHWPAEAGFWLSRSWPWFPAGTVHLAVVDPGVGTTRHIIAASAGGHVFVAPDNGLLADILERDDARVHRLSEETLARLNPGEASYTFHGRDIMAPLAAELAAGRLQLEDVGPRAADPVPSLIDRPERINGTLHGTVITIDHFGNLITNIEADMLAGEGTPVISTAGQQFALRDTYGQVTPGEYTALINSVRVLEIARSEGNAADSLGLGRGAPVTVNWT